MSSVVGKQDLNVERFQVVQGDVLNVERFQVLQTAQSGTDGAEEDLPTRIPNTELVKMEVKQLKDMLQFMGLDGARNTS